MFHYINCPLYYSLTQYRCWITSWLRLERLPSQGAVERWASPGQEKHAGVSLEIRGMSVILGSSLFHIIHSLQSIRNYRDSEITVCIVIDLKIISLISQFQLIIHFFIIYS